MTREEALEKLRACHYGDEEVDHVRADGVLCDLLASLGYGDVVEEFDSVDKWYS